MRSRTAPGAKLNARRKRGANYPLNERGANAPARNPDYGRFSRTIRERGANAPCTKSTSESPNCTRLRVVSSSCWTGCMHHGSCSPGLLCSTWFPIPHLHPCSGSPRQLSRPPHQLRTLRPSLPHELRIPLRPPQRNCGSRILVTKRVRTHPRSAPRILPSGVGRAGCV